MHLLNRVHRCLLIWSAFFVFLAAEWVLSDFHVFNLPEHHQEPAPSAKYYQMILDEGNWASLSLSRHNILSTVKMGRVTFTIFRRDSAVFPLPLDWYEGRLHSGSLDRHTRVNLGDQVLLLADKSNGDLSSTLRLFDQIVRRDYGPYFDLTRCLKELLTVYPSLNRLRFVFATVMPEEEALETICMFTLQDYIDGTSLGDPFSWTLRISGDELSGTVSSSSSWSYQKRPETTSSSSSSARSWTDSDVSFSETESIDAKPESVASNLIQSSFVSDWHPQTDSHAAEEVGTTSPIAEPIEPPGRNHRARKYQPRSCVIC